MNKAMIESYLRNLLGVTLALVTTTMANTGLASPLDFGSAEWLTVANGLWAALVPTILRYINSKDAAFGVVAEVAAKEVSKKLSTASKKAPSKKPAAKKAVATAKKSVSKSSAKKKSSR